MGNKIGKPSRRKLHHRRAQSITWSFRFSTFRKNKLPQVLINASFLTHLPIERWLSSLDLLQYQDSFKDYKEVDELLSLTEADIKKLGVRNSAHRAQIVSSLVVFRDKYEKANAAGNSNSLRAPKKSLSPQFRPPSDPGMHYEAKNNIQGCVCIGDRRNVVTMNQEDISMYESLNILGASPSNTKASRSCGDLVEMDPSQATDIQEAISLKKALEWELSLDSRDLRSHAWYHGAVSRQRSEELIQVEGEFLVRDCASQPGNYVLTCRTKITVLHFVINKILIQPETVYERVQYQFEEDSYNTVADLITFYVGSGKQISAASGARIQYPCNRTYPLSYYNYKGGMPYNAQSPFGMRGASPINSPCLVTSSQRFNSYAQPNGSPIPSPPRTKRETPPRLPSKKQRSQSLTPVQAAISSGVQNVEKYNSADGMIQTTEGIIPTHAAEMRRIISTTNNRSCSSEGVIQQTNESIRDQMMTRSTEETCKSTDGIMNDSKSCVKSMSRSIEDPAPANQLKFNMQASASLRLVSSRNSSLNRDASDSSLSACLEHHQFVENDRKINSPPPKPSRIPSKREYFREFSGAPLNRIASYHASGSDSGNGSGDSAHSSAAGDTHDAIQHRGVIIKNPRFMTNSASSTTLRSFNDLDVVTVEKVLIAMDIPAVDIVSKFDLENFQTLLLPTFENKPLDNGALNTIRMMLADTCPRMLAQHLTRVDFSLFFDNIDELYDGHGGKEDTSEFPPKNSLKCSGLELLMLPHGEVFRMDLLERTQCLKLVVAMTILICQNDFERAVTLNKWIQVAVDTKTALGNLFGFCAIMLGICMPQVQQLEQTWHILRQKFTDSAFTFEAKLRPILKSMNDCTNPQAPNTTVPHVLPYILLVQRGLEHVLQASAANQSSLTNFCINSWEQNADDFGLSILFAHLDAARSFTKNITLYQRNAQMLLIDSNARLDELLLEAFKTEFHMKFLWGSKGALSLAAERHKKMEDLLTLMAKKFCSAEN